MPDFGTPFKGNDLNRDTKLSMEEMLRILRFVMAAESEAVQLYEQAASASSNVLFKKVMRDIAREEKVHIGEFMRVLFELNPEEQKIYEEGFKEVEDMIRKPSKM